MPRLQDDSNRMLDLMEMATVGTVIKLSESKLLRQGITVLDALEEVGMDREVALSWLQYFAEN